jgi:hypothetical protein
MCACIVTLVTFVTKVHVGTAMHRFSQRNETSQGIMLMSHEAQSFTATVGP